MVNDRWFRIKEQGWGWSPASWQGWLVSAAYGIAVVGLIVLFPPQRSPVRWLTMLIAISGLTAMMAGICCARGGPESDDQVGKPAGKP